jgi:hypothetical protein
MTDPREQLAEVLEQHRPYGLDCKCGVAINSDAWWARHAADVVVEALDLTEEMLHQYIGTGYQWQRRWVSGWSVVGGEQ